MLLHRLIWPLSFLPILLSAHPAPTRVDGDTSVSPLIASLELLLDRQHIPRFSSEVCDRLDALSMTGRLARSRYVREDVCFIARVQSSRSPYVALGCEEGERCWITACFRNSRWVRNEIPVFFPFLFSWHSALPNSLRFVFQA